VRLFTQVYTLAKCHIDDYSVIEVLWIKIWSAVFFNLLFLCISYCLISSLNKVLLVT